MAYKAVVLSLFSTGLLSSTISKPLRLPGFARFTSSISISNARIKRINQARCRVNGHRRRVNGDLHPTEIKGFPGVYTDPPASDLTSAAVLTIVLTIVQVLTIARVLIFGRVMSEKKGFGDETDEPERPVLDDEDPSVCLEYMRNANEVIRTTPITLQIPEGYAVLISHLNSKVVLEEGTHIIIPFLDKVESKFRTSYNLRQIDIGQFELTGKIKISLNSYDNEKEIEQTIERAIQELVEVLRNELKNKYADGLIVRKTTNNALQALINNQAKYYHIQLNLLFITPMTLSENRDRLKLLIEREKCRNEKMRKKRRYEVVFAILAASLLRGVVSKDWQRIFMSGISLVLAAIVVISES